jgi:hypothetical protein
MLELLLCSLLTVFPDYLYRRYVQGKRLGKEITLYSVWFELRWGITACLILTVGLITVIFYNHPSTSNATLFFRTIPIVPETIGRVAEVFVEFSGKVEKGAPIFRLDSSKQEAAVESARRKIAEVEAALVVAKADILKAEGQIQEARSCKGATRVTFHAAKSSGSHNWSKVDWVELLPPTRMCRPPRHDSRRFCRRRRPAPKRRWRRRKWTWTRRSSVPA